MTNKQITIQNLILLRDAWVETDFEPNMEDFGGINRVLMKDLKTEATNDCGTTCCGIGFGPSVKGLEITIKDFSINRIFDYLQYSKRIFPIETMNPSITNGLWDFIFSGRWPNDKQQLIKRMTYVIENDLTFPEEAFDYENIEYSDYNSYEICTYKL